MKDVNLLTFMEGVIRQLHAEGRYGTAHVYTSTLRNVLVFEGGRSFFPFRLLTPTWLKAFELYLQERGKSFNTISTYLRMLRAVYNRAAAQGLVSFNPLLFRRLRTGCCPGRSRALSAHVLHRILHPQRELPPDLESVRRFFTLLFLLRGLCFVDLAYMRRADLQGDRLCYCRRKTGRPMSVRLLPEVERLLRHCVGGQPDSPALFSFVRSRGVQGYRQYQSALRYFNKQLKRLAIALEIDVNLSSYCARHSWATLANFRRHDKSLISNAMGHSSLKVTEVYFQRYDEEEIHRMNRDILAYVNKKKIK